MMKHLNNRGYTLILSVFAVVLLGVLAFSLLTISRNTLNTSSNERTDQAVYYIAETAITELKEKMTAEINRAMADTISEYNALTNTDKLAFNFNESFLTRVVQYVPNAVTLSSSVADYHDFVSEIGFVEHFGKAPTAKYAVVQEGSPASGSIGYTIQAEGDIDGKSRVTSQKIAVSPGQADEGSGEDTFIEFNPINPINVNGAINVKNFTNSLTITTPLATSLSEGANTAALINGFDNCGANCEYSYTLPDFSLLVAFASTNYAAGDSKAKLIDDNVFFTSWPNINSTTINGIVVIASGDIKISGGITINGAIIAPNSNVELSGQAVVNGPIICKTFQANNGQLTGEYTPDPIVIPGAPTYDNTKPIITEDPLLEK